MFVFLWSHCLLLVMLVEADRWVQQWNTECGLTYRFDSIARSRGSHVALRGATSLLGVVENSLTQYQPKIHGDFVCWNEGKRVDTLPHGQGVDPLKYSIPVANCFAYKVITKLGWQVLVLNEFMSLLDSFLSHLPIGSHEWESVAAGHNEKFSDKDLTS